MNQNYLLTHKLQNTFNAWPCITSCWREMNGLSRRGSRWPPLQCWFASKTMFKLAYFFAETLIAIFELLIDCFDIFMFFIFLSKTALWDNQNSHEFSFKWKSMKRNTRLFLILKMRVYIFYISRIINCILFLALHNGIRTSACKLLCLVGTASRSFVLGPWNRRLEHWKAWMRRKSLASQRREQG